MLILKIERKYKKADYTIGYLSVNGERFCNTLEDTDRGLHQMMSDNEIKKIKIYGRTAIPTGYYKLKLSRSEKFAKREWAKRYNGLVPEILEVRGFSGVRIHVGNIPADTLGCPLVGKNTVKGGLTASTVTYYELMDKYIMPAYKRGESMILIIE